MDYSRYQTIVSLGVVAVLFALTPLLIAALWRRWINQSARFSADSNPYECGLASRGAQGVRFNSEYYLYAILFLVFDVEAVFLLPFAVSFSGLSLGGFVAALIFILLVVEGLAWAWARGILKWR